MKVKTQIVRRATEARCPICHVVGTVYNNITDAAALGFDERKGKCRHGHWYTFIVKNPRKR